jgi:hypothetical protein
VAQLQGSGFCRGEWDPHGWEMMLHKSLEMHCYGVRGVQLKQRVELSARFSKKSISAKAE